MTGYFMVLLGQLPLLTATPSPSQAPITSGSVLSVSVGPATLIAGIIVALIVRVAIYVLREKLIHLLRRHDSFKVLFYIGDVVLLLLLGWLVSAAKLTDGATWQTPPPQFVVVIPLGVALFVAAVSVKVLLAVSKDKERKEIIKLSEEVELLKTANEELRDTRKRSIRIANQIRAVVDAKLSRLLDVADDRDVITADAFIEALNPREQVQFIILMIHKFFEADLPGGRLRVGVYMRRDNCLQPEYGWDGKSPDCFSVDHTRYMRLDDSGGAKSVVVQAYRSEEPLIVVSSCPEAMRTGTFQFFTPEQGETLKSLVAYRHVWGRDGKKNALVLALDTDEEHFFGRYTKDQLSEFFVEMMKRFEYEQIGLTVQAKIPHQKGTNT